METYTSANDLFVQVNQRIIAFRFVGVLRARQTERLLGVG